MNSFHLISEYQRRKGGFLHLGNEKGGIHFYPLIFLCGEKKRFIEGQMKVEGGLWKGGRGQEVQA